MIDNKKYSVIGLMSGTSLDGLDLAYCNFIKHNNNWSFDLVCFKSINYTKKWKKKLSNLFYDSKEIDLIEEDYSNFI